MNPLRAWRARRERRTQAWQAQQYATFAADLTGWTDRDLIHAAMLRPDPLEAELCSTEWHARRRDEMLGLRQRAPQ